MKKTLLLWLAVAFVLSTASAKETFVLGGPGREGELIYPQQIQEGPDGNIYVYDELDAFIKVYSPLGKFLRRIAGEGQGPGEIQRRDGVSFGFTSDKKLFFTEYFRGHRWITFMELSGELAGVLKLDIAESFGVPDAVSLPGGGFLAELHLLGEPEKQKDYFLYKSPIKLLRLDGGGKIAAEIKKTEYATRISYHPDGADSPLPFVPGFHWCLHKNKAVLFADGLSNKLEIYDLSGKLVAQIQTPLPEPEKVRDRDLNLWREERKQSSIERNPGWWHEFGSVVEKYTKSIHRVRPGIEGISSTPEGNILVSGVWDSEKGSRDYWLIDDKGKNLAQANSPLGRIHFSSNFLFSITSDEEMNIRIRCLKRAGDDKKDLGRLLSNSAQHASRQAFLIIE